NYNPVTSPCEPFTVARATPTAATTVINDTTHTGPAVTDPIGSTYHDTTTLTAGSSLIPTGTVTYSFFTNGTCASPATSTQDVTLNANGTVPNSSSTPPLAAGAYSFPAPHPADPNFNPAPSPCEPFTIAKASSSTATQVLNDLTLNPPS